MKHYKLVRKNKNVEYRNYKNNGLLKLNIASGILLVSLIAFTITNPKTFISNTQDIIYTVNEFFNDTNNIEEQNDTIQNLLKEFENKLSSNIPIEYLENYYNNIKDLKYYNNNNDFNRIFNIDGYYSINANRMVNISSDKHTMFHELMHMASSNNKSSGFSNGKTAIGLTEGYTEYLVLKLFNDDIETIFGYSKEIEVIEVLNQIIGEDKMMKYYFNND